MFCAINSSLLQWKEEKTFQLLSGACKAFAWRTCHGFMGGKSCAKIIAKMLAHLCFHANFY